MKKTIILCTLCLLGAMALVSCKKEPKKEWSKFYGYTIKDIVGEYAYSYAPDAFSGLMESDEGHLCFDAEVNISATGEQTMLFHMASPSRNFQRNFSGRPSLTSDAFLITMSSNWINLKKYTLTSEVLKNDQNNVRLNGFVSEDHYERVYNTLLSKYDTVYDYSVKYYFDVIK